MPIVSITIPCNNGTFLEQTLQSVYDQTFKDMEIILVDDGSTDGIIEKIQPNFAKAPIPIKLVKNEKNMGIGYTRQRAIEEASGKYIALLAADDCFLPQKTVKQLKLLQEGDAVCYSNYIDIDDKNNQLRIFSAPYHQDRDQLALEIWAWAKRNDCFVNFSSLMAPKKYFEQLPFDKELKRSEDLDWILKACKLFPFKFTEEPLIKYRRHAQMESNIRGAGDIITTAQFIISRAEKWWKDGSDNQQPKL